MWANAPIGNVDWRRSLLSVVPDMSDPGRSSPVLLPDLVPGAMKPEEIDDMRKGNNYCWDQSIFEKPDEIDHNLICSIGFGGAERNAGPSPTRG